VWNIRLLSLICETVFAFFVCNRRVSSPNLLFLKKVVLQWTTFANLRRWAASVASLPFEAENTTHLMSLALRANQLCFTFPDVTPSSFAMTCCLPARTVGLYVYLLVFSNRQFGCIAMAPAIFRPHRLALDFILSNWLLDLLPTLLITRGALRYINISGSHLTYRLVWMN
jgi:hypothetical protein